MIEAFFLGSGNGRIFASYHAPLGGYGEELTVVCPPLFTEYMRTHVALRDLANSLAESGSHVLRFDYRGTGDSAREAEEVGVAEWLEDIGLAVREGCEISGATTVNVLGVRASALLACRSVGAWDVVRRIVLWDPVESGAEYVLAQRRMQAAMLDRNSYLDGQSRRESDGDFAGYGVADSLSAEIQALPASVYTDVPSEKVSIVATSDRGRIALPGATSELVQFTCDWEKDSEDLMMPQPVLEGILACLIRK